MRTNPLTKVLEHLRGAVRFLDGEPTDGQLLASFIERRDEAAFAALVHRHGAMVWNVCRRVLHDSHNAEDAFQATFLVLVRKAAAVAPRELVGNWLHGVAYQTALKARGQIGRRQAREKQMHDVPEPAVAEHEVNNDWQELLDQELQRLPAKYRSALILCDLEGRTRREVARHVGVPEGTLAARVARGRDMLRSRLARRGVPVTAAVLAAALAPTAASANVPAGVMSATITAAGPVAAGQAVTAAIVPPGVASLTEGVLQAMLLSKLKNTVFVLVLLAASVGAGVWAYGQQAVDLAAAQTKEKPPADQAEKGRAGEKPAAKAERKAAPVEESDDIIRPGDRLVIHVAGTPPDEPIKGVVRVEARGTVALSAFYGRVAVANRTLEDAQKVIRAFLSQTIKDPIVLVTRYDPLLTGSAGGVSLERRLEALEAEVRRLRIAIENLQKQRRD